GVSMRPSTQFGVAVLVVGLLFLSPLGACAAAMSLAAPPPAHPCCPAPSESRCEKPACVCMSTTPAPTTVSPQVGDGQVLAAVTPAHLPPTVVVVRYGPANDPTASRPGHLFVALHQFLI